jgi:hypothetical protein
MPYDHSLPHPYPHVAFELVSAF